jgi:hypothetical protein
MKSVPYDNWPFRAAWVYQVFDYNKTWNYEKEVALLFFFSAKDYATYWFVHRLVSKNCQKEVAQITTWNPKNDADMMGLLFIVF